MYKYEVVGEGKTRYKWEPLIFVASAKDRTDAVRKFINHYKGRYVSFKNIETRLYTPFSKFKGV
jgi:glycine cleavage system regulatory protein